MRTVAQILSAEIGRVEELRESLQLAVELEFSTIPRYRCAEWSIRNGGNVQDTIDEIVIQEMGHMALACNIR
jgi:rubrerythrin